MPNSYKYHYKSPFKFLSAYGEEDHHLFFGRESEVNEVFSLFEKTNLVVLYGPSGSGKSSVAICGLTNQYYDWQSIVIRKNHNIVDSFFEQLQELFRKNECKKLKQLFLRLNECETTIQECKKGAQYDQLKKERKAISLELEELVATIFSEINFIPFFIFDQFEELFIHGTKSEVTSFSLLLSIITSKAMMSNVVLCIQTEFFVNLLKLEEQNPNVLAFKCHVEDPNEKNVYEILSKSFEYFDINQGEVIDGKRGIDLDEKTKHERIQLIIEKLKSKNGKDEVHLPFLQIYLNKLYVEDFIRTHRSQADLLLEPINIETKNYPLEFTPSEIEEFGNIDTILQTYITDINHGLKTIKNEIEGSGHEQTVVVFLKRFITEKTKTIRSVEIIEDKKSLQLQLKDQKLLNTIKEDIWGAKGDQYNLSISHLIEQLLESRILKRRGDYIELSHNLLARIIDKVRVEKDLILFYKSNFDSLFETYTKEKEENKVNPTVLGSRQIKSMEKHIKSIIKDEDELKTEKDQFWAKSKKVRLRNKVIYYTLFAVIVPIALLFWMNQQNLWLLGSQLDEKTTILDNRIKASSLVEEAIAAEDYDPTRAFGLINNAYTFIDTTRSIDINDFSLVSSVQKKFNDNYSLRPFYMKSIELPDFVTERHVIATKSRTIKTRYGNSLMLFVETKGYLLSKEIKLTNEADDNTWNHIKKEVSSFKPYTTENGAKVLYADAHGLFETDSNFTNEVRKSIDSSLIKMRQIEHMDQQTFVGLTDYSKNIVKMDFETGDLNKTTIGSYEYVKFMKKSSDSTLLFIASRNYTPYLFSMNIGNSQKIDSLNLDKVMGNPSMYDIKAFQITKNPINILIADSKDVYSIPISQISNSTPYYTIIESRHTSKINTIDTSRDHIFIGSEDKTASIFRDEGGEGKYKFDNELIGHQASILNVSYDKSGNYGITSGEDGIVLLWDLSPIENKSLTVEEHFGGKPIEIKYNSANDKLYTGFYFKKYLKNLELDADHLIGYNKTLNQSNNKIDVFIENKSNDLSIFDFSNNGSVLVVDNIKKRMLQSTNRDTPSIQDTLFTFDETIRDMRVQKNRIITATADKLIFYPDDSNYLHADTLQLEDEIINSVDLHPAKPIVLATTEKGRVYLWYPETTENRFEILEEHTDAVRVARFSNDGDFFVSGSKDNTAIAWRYCDNGEDLYEPFGTVKNHTSDINDVAISETGLIVTAGSGGDQRAFIHQAVYNETYDSYQLVPHTSLIRHNWAIKSIAFNEKDGIIYTADGEGHIRSWSYEEFDNIIKSRTAKITKE